MGKTNYFMNATDISYEEEASFDYRQMLVGFRLRKKLLISVGAAVFLIASVIALLWPPTYRSSATILIEQQEVPQELVRSTVTSYAAERIQIINQKVMTTSNLMRIIEKFELYARMREREPREEVLEEMTKSIGQDVISADVVDPRSGRPVEATIAFQVSFAHESPKIAQQVASELTTLYLDENIKKRTEAADQTRSFLADEAEKLKKKIAHLEEEISQFKSQHFDTLPELTELNIRLLDRTEQEIANIDQAVSTLRERKIYLKTELSKVSPQAPTFSDTGERVLSPTARLKFLQSQYISQSAVYSSEHPTIIRILREIDALRAEYGDNESLQRMNKQLIEAETRLSESRSKYSSDHPEVKVLTGVITELRNALDSSVSGTRIAGLGNGGIAEADNPAYLQLQADLESANAEENSLGKRRLELLNQLKDYETRLERAPEIERQYRDLAREYEQAQLKYAEVKAKELEAEVSRSLEVEQKGERFTLIEPPLQPQQPTSPNRPAILILGFIFAVGSAAGLGFVLENTDRSVKGEGELFNLTGEPPLAVVPYIFTPDEKIAGRYNLVKWVAVLVIVSVLLLIVVHTAYRPLDVLFYVIMRKIGLF